MQRLYAMFPAGAPGVGLLLLRVHLACFLPLDPCGLLRAGSPHWLLPILLAASLLLLLGLLTPLASLVALLPALWPWLVHAPVSPLASGLALLAPMAQMLLGPGAWSVDAQWFGRRVLVAPREGEAASRPHPKE
ncbi:MAG TPA: hypothetical protein VGC74_14570 [Stenotrophomonas sp.]|jgi:hypothetical protein